MTISLFRIILWAVMPKELLFGGGGGDGGAQAEADRVRAEESQTELQIAQDKAKLNALFGITDYDYSTSLEDLQTYDGGLTSYTDAQAEVDRLEGLIAEAEADPNYSGAWGATNSGTYDDGGSTVYVRGDDTWMNQMEDAQKALDPFSEYTSYDSDALTDQAESAFGTREDTLTNIYNDIMGKYTFEQDLQLDRKTSDINAMLAGRGLGQSTVGQSVFDRLGEIVDLNTTSFEEGASDAVSNIRVADTNTLQGLVQQIDAGGDFANAQTTALSDLTTNIDQSVSAANARDLTDLFKGMDELYGQTQYVDAYNQGQTYGSSNIVTPGSGASGSGSIVSYN